MRKLLTSLGFAASIVLMLSYTAVAVGLMAVVLVTDQVCEAIERHT